MIDYDISNGRFKAFTIKHIINEWPIEGKVERIIPCCQSPAWLSWSSELLEALIQVSFPIFLVASILYPVHCKRMNANYEYKGF